MFGKIRASLDLRTRLGGVEATLIALDTRVDRSTRKLEEDLDWLRDEVQRLRGRVTGKLRNKSQVEEVAEVPDWEVIDDQIRKGIFQE